MNMVVLDTNILVSAFLSPGGNSAKIMTLLVDGQLRLCYSNEILNEYKDVILRPKFSFEPAYVHVVLDRLTSKGVCVTPSPLGVPFSDEDDRKFYETAKFCCAPLVTGNLRHFPQEPDVMSPAEFLNQF